jgi:Flp pilus assembly protein TadD
VAAVKYPHSVEVAHDLALGCLEQGTLLGRLGREKEALKALDRAIELDPKLAAAYFNRGNVYAALGQRSKAAADYRQAVKLQPKLRLNLPPYFAKII